jgi:membrane protein insertase Oxa1/YidC/SpoIIIJ
MFRGLRSINSATTNVVKGLSKQIVKKNAINVFGNTIRNNNVPLISAIRFYSSSNIVTNSDNSSNNNIDKVTDMVPEIGDVNPIIDSTSNLLDAANTVIESELVLGNYPSHFVMKFIENIHEIGNLPYWEAIIITTCLLRLLMLPLGIKTAQGGARMAAMRPDMDKLQKAMSADPLKDDMRIKMKYQEQMKGKKKYVFTYI